MAKDKFSVSVLLKGAAMGMAEVIPGVSGGTIAFITGIYEKLLNSIKAFDFTLFSIWKKGGFTKLAEHIHFWFLISLVSGMAMGIIAGVFGIEHLMREYPILLWSFFTGLIIASAIYIGRMIKSWNATLIFSMIIGFGISLGITFISPVSGSENLIVVLFSGILAISALLLPGVSGSFILLLLGMYLVVIPAVKNTISSFSMDQFLIVLFFALGCIIGLTTFSRVLSWMFKKYRDLTLAVLTGFMLGSLRKIYPWRLPTEWLDEEGNVLTSAVEGAKPIKELLYLPHQFPESNYLLLAIICMVVGSAIVFVLDRFSPDTNM